QHRHHTNSTQRQHKLRAAREEKEEERGMAGCGEAKTSSVSMDEEACGIEKKFGGMAPKKPLISKVTALAARNKHCRAAHEISMGL
uniref:Uncharacterized protein n=1 Tax=Aegilops tauschii subsp. strangulata TaxID=200361 RepID=A0A453I920_AEGTS